MTSTLHVTPEQVQFILADIGVTIGLATMVGTLLAHLVMAMLRGRR
jgi:hypothetical protein